MKTGPSVIPDSPEENFSISRPDTLLSCAEACPPFYLFPGASWISPEGLVFRIRGFHDRWISEHPELARGAKNTAQLILATGWIAATLYDAGHLEIIAPTLVDERVRHCLDSILEHNPGRWLKVHILSLDSPGSIDLEARTLQPGQSPSAMLLNSGAKDMSV